MTRTLGVAIGLAALMLVGCAGTAVPNSAGSKSSVGRSHGAVSGASASYTVSPATPLKPSVTPGVTGVAGAEPTAYSSGIVAGPSIASLKIDQVAGKRALTAFRLSCPALLRRSDASGLTANSDWTGVCAMANSWNSADAVGFFVAQFETVQVGTGASFATGYYEPEIAGSRVRAPGYDVPVYSRPPDEIDVDLGQFSDRLANRRITGRLAGTSLVPYYTRAEIEDGALAGKGLELAWAADPIEFFFLQVQGSGRLKLPDGSVMRIGYAGQNGRDYTGIGALMRDRGLVVPGQLSMQGIMAYLRAHPADGTAIRRENKSWVFFRELTGDGPVGALGVAVTAQGSVAADPAFVPLGAPVFLSMDRADATGLWVAQDTGGAIKGANRFDTFWGAGDSARLVAGGMSARGTAFVMVPRGVLARLTANRIGQGSALGGGTTP
ncbi:MltA domain-containing protein [Sphingomonas sp.]|uniref:murein transglycosylase A n=1 Tax=Sphingomonas sp. TaxID=28214 RepID=UPI0025F6492F|nr:MltA domain-containing protein [Sphingomonas sp.]